MESNPLFYVIDVKATYNMLFKWSWIHHNDVITSTFSQCFKYCRNCQVKIVVAYSNPFTIVWAHFVDVKFNLENTFVEELQPTLGHPNDEGEPSRQN